MNTEQMLREMFAKQEELNCQIHPQWRDQKFPWHRAIWTECAEMLEEYGWKWWKKAPELDMNKVKMELVDIWHFVMCDLLQLSNFYTNHDVFITTVYHSLSYAPIAEAVEQHSVQHYIENLAYSALDKDTMLGDFTNLLFLFDMPIEELYMMYMAKNILNQFRQDHGFKEGTYRKIWGEREDNEVLLSLLVGMTPEGIPALYGALENVYQGILNLELG